MAPVVFDAIVLKSYETGNSSEVVHVISADFGRLSVYAKGLRTPRSRFRPILQPLHHVQLTVYLKEGAEMATLREASSINEQDGLTGDFERLTLGLLLAEAAAQACEVHQPAPELFAALLEALAELDPRAALPAPAAGCRGLLTLLYASGYEPRIEEELLRPWPPDRPRPLCFWMQLQTATIHARGVQPASEPDWPMRTPPAAPDVPIPPQAVRFLYEAIRGRQLPPLPEHQALALLDALVRLFEYHHESPLRSATFWRKTTGVPG
jgi:DNA repair protein RecO (recombination protein O)